MLPALCWMLPVGSCCLTPAERGDSVWRSLASLREAICPLAKGTGEVSLPFPILKLHAGPQEGPQAFQLGPEFCLNWGPPICPRVWVHLTHVPGGRT